MDDDPGGSSSDCNMVADMTDKALIAARDTLDGLTLSESDLVAGDRIVNAIAAFKSRVDLIDDSEPWLKRWLDQEHKKGAVLFTAAKVNRNKNGFRDAPATDPHSRASIIRRFNEWTTEVVRHIDEYVASDRSEAVVRPWWDRATAFYADPLDVNN